MKDRVPKYPGRVKFIPVSGQTNVYTMERADQPTETGTPINKATLLKDSTAELYGLGPDATPDDVFKALAVPKYSVYGVQIDTKNSNPATAVTYTDDALGMTAGSSEWDTLPPFNGIRPCLFKDGRVENYLNPNDFTKTESGGSADITSGNSGDVMIEIPKIGFKISTTDDYISVKITNEPGRSDFCYYAHSRTNGDIKGDRDSLYIGAYLGYLSGSKLYSRSGVSPTADTTIADFRVAARARGTGYDIMSYYPFVLMQCLYLIKYKNLNSQLALGNGYVSAASKRNTGVTNAKGMCYGASNGQTPVKLFGMEDFWGNLWAFIDGIHYSQYHKILTSFSEFNDMGNGYQEVGSTAGDVAAGWMSKSIGTSLAGFFPLETSGSSSTYYCDNSNAYGTNNIVVVGGAYSSASATGIFRLSTVPSSYTADANGARLMYL